MSTGYCLDCGFEIGHRINCPRTKLTYSDLEQQLAECDKERRGVISESKMHPSWLEKSKEELLDALRFQGATTAALLEETDGYRKQIVELRTVVIQAANYIDVLGGYSKGHRQSLAATQDLSGLVLCYAEVNDWDDDVPLYRRKQP